MCFPQINDNLNVNEQIPLLLNQLQEIAQISVSYMNLFYSVIVTSEDITISS